MKPRIGLLLGDYAGIGPEIIARHVIEQTASHLPRNGAFVEIAFEVDRANDEPPLAYARLENQAQFSADVPVVDQDDGEGWQVEDNRQAKQMRGQLQRLRSVEYAGIQRGRAGLGQEPAEGVLGVDPRLDGVAAADDLRFHRLLTAFKAETGVPVLINTSFNVRGEPLVCSPEDAWHCFMGSDVDVLVMGNQVLHKADQNPSHLQPAHITRFEDD